MGDWDGDGTRTPGVIRPEEDPAFSDRDEIPLVWYLRNSHDAGPADVVLRYGVATSRETFDTPVVGDWDGDGTETAGVHRDLNRWLLTDTHAGGAAEHDFRYGADERDRPIVWR